MTGRVGLVTDSTSNIPAALAAQWGITVVPTQLHIGEHVRAEHVVPKEMLVTALEQNLPVRTSPPDPAGFTWAYQDMAARGVDEVISVHLSSRQSQTWEVARQAAARSPVPVHVIDSQTTGMSLGYAVLAAARTAGAGGSARRVMSTLTKRLDSSAELFYVDTLEYLRRGGKIGAATALLGSTLSLKPLLTVLNGQIAPLERVLGAERALRRLVENAVRRAGGRQVDVAIEHFGAPTRAQRVLGRLRQRLPTAREITFTEVSSAIGVHVGPGAIGVAISPA
ncbi:DegV family protein [Actinophytocola xanthii]|uniref:Fatty acid-binding protein DegV n=1 Tax=Actinophytocola xanthii TaxID=1912961 RepID=A0A1Q8CWV6_9PSEU|nr:DegV family protein [Actinophytocola xanthii]OLF18836.1 fatty acid-binding protein DegV [Actinophytocola xanthii]